MPCLSTVYNPKVGPLIQVAILSPDAVGAGQIRPPEGATTMYMALADTGASNTCVSSRIVGELSLAPVGKVNVAGVHGSAPTNMYQFAVGFLFSPKQEASGAIVGEMSVHVVEGTEFRNENCGFDVLLGRDVLCKGTMQISFDGHFMLCF